MPTLSRRRLLQSGPALAVAVAAPVAAHANTVSESVELLDLGARLVPTLDALKVARAKVTEIVAKWSPKWPFAPEDLFNGWGGEDFERDLIGCGVPHQHEFGGKRLRSLWTTKELDGELALCRRVLRGRSIDKRNVRCMNRAQWEERLTDLAELRQTAERYESECDKVRRASGYAEAKNQQRAATNIFATLVDDIMKQEPATAAGVTIQARALALFCDHCSVFGETPDFGAIQRWSGRLAVSVLRVA